MDHHHTRRQAPGKQWGIFRKDGQVDVVPCNFGGEITHGHVLGPQCPCKPRVDKELYYATIYIHDNRLTEASDG
jgi:hypothetical protein